jgi:nitroreductase
MTDFSRRRFLGAGAGIGAALSVPGGLAASATGSPTESLPFFDVLTKRRSVRRYKTTPVPDAHLKLILEAGRLAPDAANQQPWRFLVVRDRARIERIKKEALGPAQQGIDARRRAYLDGVLSAPVHVLVLVDMQAPYPECRPQDGSLAAGQMMLAARALGYGTVFITSGVPEEVTRRVLAIPDRYQRICLMPLGVPDEATPDGWPLSPPKKRLEELAVYETVTE